MKKWGLLFFVFVLIACSDQTERKSVSEVIPKEQKEVMVTNEPNVTVHTPISTTTGYVIKQHKRDKWLVVNATHVSGHPNAIIEDGWMTVGEVVGIDVEHNIAIIHFRNSYDFNPLQLVEKSNTDGIDLNGHKLSYFESQIHDKRVKATSQQIQTLLTEAQEQPITWEKRYEKNEQLRQNQLTKEVDNFTTHYEKNIFTYNPDELKHFGELFIESYNESVKAKNWSTLSTFIGSDELLEELQYVKDEVQEYEVKAAKKDGVFYFVNGIDENNKEVRLTIISEQGNFKVIGTNLIDSDVLTKQKIASIDLTKIPKLEEVPALSMFINKHLDELKLKNEKGEWHLERVDKKIKAKFKEAEKMMNLSCSAIAIEKNDKQQVVQLIACSQQKDRPIVLGYIK